MVLGCEEFTIITLNNVGRGGEDLKSSKPILGPPPLQGGKNPCGVKRGGVG